MSPRNAAVRAGFSNWISESNDITRQFMSLGIDPAFISLAGGLPAPEFYPTSHLAVASEQALDRWGPVALDYGPIEGLPALRSHIAERMSKEAGRPFTVENVLMTAGAMQGLDLVGKVLLDAGDRIVAQFPTYVGALDAWRPRLPVYEPLVWTDPGANVDMLRTAKFVYAVPNYSNPTGVLVPTPARQALLERVLRAGCWLVEDDPYLPLQYDGPTGPSILALHARMKPQGEYDGPVVYLGTLSKSIVPGLRVGWAVASRQMIQAMALAKQSSDIGSSMLTHAIALELLEAKCETRHVPNVVTRYRERRDALCQAAEAHLQEWFEWDVPPGGMFVWMRARRPGIDTDALYGHALREKVAFVPGSVFDPTGQSRSAMRVNFTRNSPELLKEGVVRLARAAKTFVGSSS